MRGRVDLRLPLAAAALAVACAGCCSEGPPSEAPSLCVPAPAAAGEELTVLLREDCGGPGDGLVGCEVSVTLDGAVDLRVIARECPYVGDDICGESETGCRVPPLSAGTHELRLDGRPIGTLEVAPGGLARCAEPVEFSRP